MENIHSNSWMNITYFIFKKNFSNKMIFFKHPWYNYKMEWCFFKEEFSSILKLLDGSQKNRYFDYYFIKPIRENYFNCEFINKKVKEEFKDLFMEVNRNSHLYFELFSYEEYLECNSDNYFIYPENINYKNINIKSIPIDIKKN